MDFCRRWNVRELSVFGSALRNDLRPDSDVDILVTFTEGSHPTLFDLVQMQTELKDILGREIDLVSRRGIETSRNYIRKQAILDSAQVIYESR